MITILGTGQVGKAILEQLRQLHPNEKIQLVNKTGVINGNLNENESICSIDVTVAENLINLFANSKIVFSCTDVPYQFWKEFYPKLSIAMIVGLQKTNAKLVFADNMYSYGNVNGNLIHEKLPNVSNTHKGKIRADIINSFKNAGVNERVAIVKSSDFIGPNISKGLFGVDFINQIQKGKTVYLPGDLNLPHHFTFIDDFAKAMVLVGFDETAYGETWNVPNDKAISQKEWIRLFENETNLKIKYRATPKIAIQVLGLFNSFIYELKELSYQFDNPYIIDSSKFINKYSDISTSHFEIVKKTINWYFSK